MCQYQRTVSLTDQSTLIRRSILALCTLFISLGCDEPVGPRRAPTLMVAPESLTLPQPIRGVGYSERSIYITNIGEGELTIQQITISEDEGILILAGHACTYCLSTQ